MSKPAHLLEKEKPVRGKRWVLPVVNLILVIACACAVLLLWHVSRLSPSITAAERFRGESEMRFAQMAAYLPEEQGKTVEDIYTLRQTLESRFVEQALQAPEGGRLYLDAYSGVNDVVVRSDKASAQTQAIGVGGDFFYFHPLELRHGAYFAEEDLVDDLVILDEEMAWRLFGGTDLAGMTVTVNGEPFVVGGVISREEDFATAKAYEQDAGIFMSYSAMLRLMEDTTIACYEVVMPDPISGYARGIMEEIFPPQQVEVVEMSGRFAPGRLLHVIGSFGERSMGERGVIYPYWENALRVCEDYAALFLVLAVVLALCPLICLVLAVIALIRRIFRLLFVTIPNKMDDAVERRREKRYMENVKRAGGE